MSFIHRSMYLVLIFACGIAASLEAFELQQLQPLHSPRPGDMVEWELSAVDEAWLTAPSSATPFMLISESDGSQWRRAAFRYQSFRTDPLHRNGEYQNRGPVTLRIRHSPRVSGSLRWQLFAPGSDPSSATPLASDSMQVLPGQGPAAAIAQAPFNKRLLAKANGDIFIPIGPNIAWSVGDDRLALFITYLDRLHAVGGNHIRVWCSSWFGQIEGTEPQNWRLDQAWLLDQLFIACHQRGIYLTLVLDNHHDFQTGKNFPYGKEIGTRAQTFFTDPLADSYQERLNYLIARYGHEDHLLAWELFNEIDLTGIDRFRLVNWARAAAAHLRSNDPYQRLRTISWAGADWPEMRALPDINFFQIHRYLPHLDQIQPGDRDLIAIMVGDTVPLIDDDRPFIFAEVGHHGESGDLTPGNDIDKNGLILAHKAWAGFLLGGAGPGMNWWWDTWIDTNDLWFIYRPLVDTISRINWQDRQLKPMEVPLNGDLRVIGWQSPTQAIVWPQSISDNWHQQLVAKVPNPLLGKRLTVTMNGMSLSRHFSVIVIDMFSGAVTHSAMARSNTIGQLAVALPPHNGNQIVVIQTIP